MELNMNPEKPVILIVDDQLENIQTIRDILGESRYRILEANNGVEALKTVVEEAPDLILLDALMPVMDGFETAKIIRSNSETKLIPIIMITALDSLQDRVKGLESGVDDFITRPFNIVELRARIKNLLRLRESLNELENAEQVIFTLAKAVEAKDKYTEGHCNRLANLAESMGKFLNLPENDTIVLRRGGFLHDIGKIAISDQILLKPGPLTKEEFEIIKKHPVIGEEICSPLKTLRPVLPVIRYHHERFNGQGYPEGLAGQNIPLHARIVGLVDCYDSLTTHRPYRRALTHEQALEICDKETKRGLWDPELFESLKALFKDHRLNRVNFTFKS